MIQFSILFIFFILHIIFFIYYFLFGLEYNDFFGIPVSYIYNSQIAFQAFLYSSAAFIALFFGLKSNKFFKFKTKKNKFLRSNYNSKSLKIFVFISTGIALFNSINIILDNSGYSYISALRLNKSSMDAILYELRYFTLIYLSYNLLNYSIKDLFRIRPRTFTILISILYVLSCTILQTRSIIFEIFFVYIYSFFLWNGNKIKFKYIFSLFVSSIIPNLLLLARVDLYLLNTSQILSSILQYEYSYTLANLISTNIVQNKFALINEGGITFFSKLYILIPSPLRNLLGIKVGNLEYYTITRNISEAFGGGFSFLGELYSNFSIYSLIIVFILGLIIARMISINLCNLGSANITQAVYPIIISNFILSLRNDIFPFIKISIYLFIAAFLMKLISRIKL